jgi:hypothetical protein
MFYCLIRRAAPSPPPPPPSLPYAADLRERSHGPVDEPLKWDTPADAPEPASGRIQSINA